MHDAQDAEDTRRLEAGEFGPLLEGYVGVIRDRCLVKIRNRDDAEDVAQNVFERLLAELKRGRRYRVPFRVVVNNVIGWKVKEHFQAVRYDAELDDWLLIASTESDAPIEVEEGFAAMIEGLTELESIVIRLHYGDEDLGFQEIARRLERDPNTIYQIHWRALDRLRGEYA